MVIFERKISRVDKASLQRFLLRARRAVGLRGPVDVLVTTNAAMQVLNRKFRHKNKATDVLSFPSPLPISDKRALAGEIAISAEIAQQNARVLGHAPAVELRILILHGLLHLAGFDHERDNGEMAAREGELRRLLKLPVALIERTETGRNIRNGRGLTSKHPGRRRA